MGRARRRHRRRQSAACAVSRTSPGTRARTARRAGCSATSSTSTSRPSRNSASATPRARGCASTAFQATLDALRDRAARRLRGRRRSEASGARASLRSFPGASSRGQAMRAARRSAPMSRAAAMRCAAMRCSKRCRSSSTRTTPPSGAGPPGPRPIAIRRRRAVARLRRSTPNASSIYDYLQWQAELQLAGGRGSRRASRASRSASIPISRSRSIAAAPKPGRIRTCTRWAPASGAPPDAFNLRGQDWGLPPLIPARLRDAAYAPFLATLRANMRHAGALRIDHVMGLARLFWVPAGRPPATAPMSEYPFDDLLGLLALESHRHRCLVIGEDLGTVPDYMRAALAKNAVLSYRVLIFEREGSGDFKPPAEYPPEALVTDEHARSAHARRLVVGRRHRAARAAGADRDGRRPRGADSRADATIARASLRRSQRGGLLPAAMAADVASHSGDGAARSRAPFRPTLRQTRSRLQVVQLEDVLGVRGAGEPARYDRCASRTGAESFRWRSRRWPDDARFDALAATLARERPRRGASRRVSAEPAAGPAHVPRATYRAAAQSHVHVRAMPLP